MRKFYIVLLSFLFVPFLHTHAVITGSSVLGLINTERQAAGLMPVRDNAKLDQAAQMKAEDMARQSYFAHRGPDGKGPQSWLAAVGYEWSATGEILAFNSQTDNPQAIVDGWMNSPTHKSIITDGRYTETGIGVAIGTYQSIPVVYVAEEFGMPKSVVTAPAPKPVVVPVVTTIAVPKVTAQVTKSALPKAEAQIVGVVAPVATTTSTSTITLPEPALRHDSWLLRMENMLVRFLSRVF